MKKEFPSWIQRDISTLPLLLKPSHTYIWLIVVKLVVSIVYLDLKHFSITPLPD